MKIKQVEELVGITRKNIRFYEEQGLLNVARAENGYREYHQADVIRLQEIKLFRKMDISIEEMKLLFEKKKSLQICLEQHLKELDHRKEGLSKMQDMCERLILEHRSLESLNAEDCLEEIEQMEKEGAKFMDINKMDVHKKKRNGAIIGAAVASYDYNYILGKHTGSDSDRIVFAAGGNSDSDHCGNAHSTCRKNERNRRRRRR